MHNRDAGLYNMPDGVLPSHTCSSSSKLALPRDSPCPHDVQMNDEQDQCDYETHLSVPHSDFASPIVVLCLI